ncbi:15404_t:CDS:2 [Entrophospora sp. SA101]|nr:15404_t:CDS:2 [Entrophospora sp. SA101]
MPEEDEVTIRNGGGIKNKWGRQALRLTSPQRSSGIEEYLDEFREWRDDKVELPTIEGSTEAQVGVILAKLKFPKNRTFENYYVLGKLINEYPSTVRKSINWIMSKSNVEDKRVRLTKRTVILFDIVGLSYLSLRRLTPRTLQNLSNEKFEELISGAREIVAERLAPPNLLEE